MSSDEYQDVFAEAEHARNRAADTNAAAGDIDAFVERQMRAAWATRASSSSSSSQRTITSVGTGPCVPGLCRGEHLSVSLWSMDNAAIHVCCPRFCTLPAEVHTRPLYQAAAPAAARALPRCLKPGTEGGGVYWCERHTRMHVCRPASCPHTYTNSLGFKCCVLSGQTVGQAVAVAFGQGLAVVSAEAAYQRNLANRSQAQHARERKRKAATPLERFIRPVHDGTEAASTNTIVSSAVTSCPALDLDAPSADLFPDDGADNTFGDGLAEKLLMTYTQAYATVEHIVFGQRRAELEAAAVAGRLREAETRITQYATDRFKAGLAVDLTMCRQLEHNALTKSKRLFKRLLVPEGSLRRMRAYYAAVCTEFYTQLCGELHSLSQYARLPPKTKQACERFLMYSEAEVMPNILDIMHEGLRIREHVIVPEEPLFRDLFPESLTLDRLGIGQKICTDVKKLLKRCVLIVITEANRPVVRLQTTQLDLTGIMHGTEPVWSLFLEARRDRLGLTE